MFKKGDVVVVKNPHLTWFNKRFKVEDYSNYILLDTIKTETSNLQPGAKLQFDPFTLIFLNLELFVSKKKNHLPKWF